MKFAICLGHSRQVHGRTEGGAVSTGDVSEHAYNSGVAERLAGLLRDAGHAVVLWDRYGGQGYPSAMRWLAAEMRREGGIGAAVELHFNASDDPASHGYEYLHLAGSVAGERLAGCLEAAHAAAFPAARNRGRQGIRRGGRGHPFLELTPPPAVICEPFFGSNPDEWAAPPGHAYVPVLDVPDHDPATQRAERELTDKAWGWKIIDLTPEELAARKAMTEERIPPLILRALVAAGLDPAKLAASKADPEIAAKEAAVAEALADTKAAAIEEPVEIVK